MSRTSSSTGNANIDGTGNALANVITGNGADNVLDGGAGADRMSGGAGNDTYIVDHEGDAIVEIAGDGTIRSAPRSVTAWAQTWKIWS